MSDETVQVIDAPEARQEHQAVNVPAVIPPSPPALEVAPQIKPKDLVDRLNAIKETMDLAMVEGVDYGKVPGTDKPTLLKPGAEKLGVVFQLDIQPRQEQRFEAGGHLTVTSRATVFHAPTGARIGYGEGVCTTRERKYAYRKEQLRCPDCANTTVYQSKKDDEPGFFCWKKKGGCGNTFAPDDERITRQPVGEVENTDLPDLWNTVTKMAEKRARVDAVLAVTGASAIFTQDVEDTPQAAGVDGGSSSAPAELPGWASMLSKERAPLVLEQLERVLEKDAAKGILTQVYRQLGGLPQVLLPFTKTIADIIDPSKAPSQPEAAQPDAAQPEAQPEAAEPVAAADAQPAQEQAAEGIFDPPASPIFDKPENGGEGQ